MKNTILLLSLVICVLGCNRVTAPPVNSNLANTSATPAQPVKVVDLPSLVVKSRDEIKEIVRGVPTRETPDSLEYSFPQCDLTIQYTKDKPSRISFSFKMFLVGDRTMSGTNTADQLGDMVRIDVHGQTPTSTNGPFHIYEQAIGGKKVAVTFHKIGDQFTSVAIEPK
jgi:hypothetical protein